ncbi:MAG: serine hydrolase [Patescibacteria group bacterium]|jgi:D-alanyl-D-alanine carboxypeptidase
MFWTTIVNIITTLFFGFHGVPAVTSGAESLILNPGAPKAQMSAERGAVLAANDRFFLFAERADEVQPIASITKLMTALVFLDNNPGWDKAYTITEADKVEGGRLNLFLGDEVTVKDLFYTSLVASDNGATLALVHASGLSEEEFVKKMNEQAVKLGLKQTSFSDPVGLSEYNLSTAREVALLAQAAFKRSEISEATTKPDYLFMTLNGREKKIESTDYLLFDSGEKTLTVLGGKTGYTEKAGYCFVGRLKNSAGREVISVVLNSQDKNGRFKDSKSLANWVFTNYDWIK